jgi:hypothetical protein
MAKWEWMLNWNQVRDDLLIGSCPMTGDDIARIRDEGEATALLSLQSDICRRAFGIDWEELRATGEALELAMVNAPMLDFDPPDQRRNLPRAVACLSNLLGAGHRVYLHCTAGANRAPLTALAYLTFVEMQPSDAAMALLRERRPQSDPSWEAYDGCRADLVDALRENIMVRAYYLSQEGTPDDAQAHWVRAEAEMIHDAFVNGLSAPRGRLDPSRE